MRLPIKSETDGDLSATYYTDADEELVAMVMKFDTATGRNASVRYVDFLELVRLANIGADAKSHHDAATIKSYAADAMTVREAYRIIQGGHRDETLLLDSLDDLADRMAAAKVENSHDAGLREGLELGERMAMDYAEQMKRLGKSKNKDARPILGSYSIARSIAMKIRSAGKVVIASPESADSGLDSARREGELRGLRRAAEICDAGAVKTLLGITKNRTYRNIHTQDAVDSVRGIILAEIAKGEK